jgi:hypothetical protein
MGHSMLKGYHPIDEAFLKFENETLKKSQCKIIKSYKKDLFLK